MTIRILGRMAGAMALTLALAGCIDMTMDLDIQSDTTAKSTVTTVMGADFYPMVKSNASNDKDSSEGFCNEEGATLTENADGSASCVQVREGPFADLMEGEENGMTITQVSPGVVRVAFDTKSMQGDLASSTGTGGEEEMDAETKAMISAIFAGHTMTLRVHGVEVTDTNMDLSGDKTTAEKSIPFVDLMNGTAGLPDELYAVLRTN